MILVTALLRDAEQARNLMRSYVLPKIGEALKSGQRLELEVRSERRSSEQNAKLWGMLTDVSRQVEWYGKHLAAEDWKHVFSASLRKLDVVPNIDGTGFVALGLSTSSMSVREMVELIDLIDAFGSQRGVRWSHEPASTPA